MKTVCKMDMCNGCMACLETCSKHAVLVKQEANAFNAVIDSDKCVNCNACYKICPRNDNALNYCHPINWYQGWSNSNEIRSQATSGGVASAISQAFLRMGGFVCGCVLENGEFKYIITNQEDDLSRFAGSKYVKSNPKGIYHKIVELLRDGEKVLFVGLPCHVAAVIKFVGYRYSSKLYTIDLICHGTPAQVVFKKYLIDHRVDILQKDNIAFRSKNVYRLQIGEQSLTAPRIADRYLYSFLKRINYTSNCYECQFSRIDRVSDLTLGDSWGTELSAIEQKKGISLLLSQGEKGNELIKMADLTLLPVDLDKAIESNAQLQHSSKAPPERQKFFNLFNNGVNYDRLMFKIYPLFFIKQDVKKLMLNLHLLRDEK